MRIPKLLQVLSVAVMLCACVFLALWCVADEQQRSAVEKTQNDLDFSRQREVKQQREYDRAAEELPGVKEALAEQLPRTEAAQTEEAELRAERKALRSEISGLEAQLGEGDSLESLLEEAQALLDALPPAADEGEPDAP